MVFEFDVEVDEEYVDFMEFMVCMWCGVDMMIVF